MAKPIRATPTLKGEDATRFIREVLSEQKRPSKNRLNLLKDADRIIGFNSKRSEWRLIVNH